MLEYFVFVATLASAVANPLNQYASIQNISIRTIGGKRVTIERVPYQVSIHYNDFFQCGGVIISKEWIITAASCIFAEPEKHSIRAGSTVYSDGGSKHKVDNIILHPNWDLTNGYHSDIALVHTSNALQFDETRQPVFMFDTDEESIPGASAVISGWGRYPHGAPSTLQSVDLYIISKKKCDEFYEGKIDVEDKVCVGHLDGNKDACVGDHGGPLSINGRLAGIISLAIYCGRDEPNVPSMHTEISVYRSWIKSVTGI